MWPTVFFFNCFQFSLKLRNLSLVILGTNLEKFKYFLRLRVRNPLHHNLTISAQEQSRLDERFFDSANQLQDICAKLALFSFEYANTIQAIADGNISPEVPVLSL